MLSILVMNKLLLICVCMDNQVFNCQIDLCYQIVEFQDAEI